MEFIPREIICYIISYITTIRDIYAVNRSCKLLSRITNECVHTLYWDDKYNNINILCFNNLQVIDNINLHLSHDILHFLSLKKLKYAYFTFPTDTMNYCGEFYDSVYQYLSAHNIDYRNADITFGCVWYAEAIDISDTILIYDGMLCFHNWAWDKSMKILNWGIENISIKEIYIDAEVVDDKNLDNSILKWLKNNKIKEIKYHKDKNAVNCIVLNRDGY
ncbi:Hypothetical protein ORPV_633 [Orpheovirus IHUMI-LCC2]|uniref:F-box domain-containing protein n=1 Tax=Orpheovirus IHUMI-LCC2 TaxID=2023057 RepID=A0A2I2L4T6_9VIRU|nr:Hypothetical protein ORPV_633 [Orpheovirus IHUMI-LCC2]SNW62537.1 Hypothetical protein ORPV_633 [Orpheovirus IHUMI-LCC2]